MNVWIAIIVLQILTTARVGNGHGRDMNDWRPLTPRPYRERPVDVIVDVVNDLGIKLLDCYMERPGNVAFSPAGLAFVLAALYEGSAGRGNRQIAHILGLPRDRRITRIGVRDIHRRLRSYLNADTFLGGLTLNRDDITLRPEYEDVLRFYGFDIANMTSGNDTTTMDNTTTTSTIATNLGMITTMNGNDSMTITTPLSTTIGAAIVATTTTTTTTTDATTTATPNTIDMDSTSSTSTPTPTPTPTLTPTLITTTPQSLQVDTTVPAATTPTVNPLAELIPSAITTNSAPLVGNMMDSTLLPMTTSIPSTQTVEITTIATQNTSNDTSPLNSTIRNIIGMNNATDDNQTRLMTSAVSGNSSDDMQAIIPTVPSVTTMNPSNQSTVAPVLKRDDNNVRKRRSIKNRRSFPIYQDNPVWIDDLDGWQDYASTFDDDITGTPDQRMTQLNFLIHGCDASTISTITYTAILPFAYFPALRALALEFPLDDPRYNVIVLIPAEGNDSRTLNRLLATKTLRKLRQSLRPTWVRTTVPSFTLRGFITLTPYLQRLGIKDAFEPRAADLSPMSPDLGVYARDVQQSIGVNIRNFMKNTNDTLPTMSATGNTYPSPGNVPHTTRTPIPFIANRPFLFFIVDNETSIALIAGRVDDPLNSRIN